MKRRIIAILMTLALAGTFVACGGSKEGAENAVVADESIADLSISSSGATAESVSAAGGTSANAATTTPAASASTAGQTGGTDIITPIPAQEFDENGQPVASAQTDGQTASSDANNAAGTSSGAVSGQATAGTSTGTAAGTTTSGTTADAGMPKTMLVTKDINVRDGADIEADILGGYDEGDEITVTGMEGEWYIVEYYGETGYVNSKYLKAVDSTSESGSTSSDEAGSANSKYGKLIDGDGDPVDLRYYDGSYEIYDEDGNRVYIEGVND
ncbi:MAG: SH3 domain-containing protein [Lachnospiraceae bacterium]|nr:SH3 domain-containing protein [Lachnospiraceae bacterium]